MILIRLTCQAILLHTIYRSDKSDCFFTERKNKLNLSRKVKISFLFLLALFKKMAFCIIRNSRDEDEKKARLELGCPQSIIRNKAVARLY